MGFRPLLMTKEKKAKVIVMGAAMPREVLKVTKIIVMPVKNF